MRRLRPKSLDARMYLSNGWGGDCCLGRTAESAPTYVPKTEGSRTAETAPLDESRGEEGWADCYPSWDQCQRGHLRMLVKFLMLGQNVANLWGCGFFFKTFFLSPPAACCSRGEPMPVERRNIVKKKKKIEWWWQCGMLMIKPQIDRILLNFWMLGGL